MKKLIYLLIALGVVSQAGAKSINPSQADAIASGFLKNKAIVESGINKAPGINRSDPSPYYVYNAEGGGFVIVSGDDRFGEILAYSHTGAINVDEIPDGLNGLLNLYTVAFDALPADETTSVTNVATEPSVIVKPLLGDINWGQDEPFNALTPISSGTKHFYTGCVACAATQIMRYYSYPAKGTGSKTYTDPLSHNTLTADFENTVYQWDNMPAKVPELVTAEQTQAYSTLAAQFGVAVEMQYEANGSGAYDMLVPYALRNYFGYDAGLRIHMRDYYSTSEWMDMIKNELSEGRPVFYGGTSDRGSGGHAFVLDGYDSQDFVHVNWGWYGNSNGYFRINHLDPSSLGEGGGAGGYNLSQDMIIGIQPAKEGSVRSYSIYGETRLSVNGPFNGTFSIMSFIGNLDVEPFVGRIEGALVKDGEILATLGGVDFSLDGFKNGYSGSELLSLKNVESKVTGIADGDGYELCLVYKSNDQSQWNILRHANGVSSRTYAIVTGGNIIIDKEHKPHPDVVLHSAIVTDGDIYAGGRGRALFTMESRTGDYNVKEITMRLTSVDDPAKVFDSKATVMIYNQSVEDVDITFPVSEAIPAGKYYLDGLIVVDEKEYAFALNGHERAEVNVLPVTTDAVARLIGSPSWQVNNAAVAVPDRLAQGEFVYVNATFRNAGVPGVAKVLARFINNETGLASPLIMQEVTFEDERNMSVTFARQVPHDPGTYTVEFVQIGNDYSETLMPQFNEPLSITVDPSDKLVAKITEFNFPEKISKTEKTPFSFEAIGCQTITNTLYVRIRQLTNKNGEIVMMKSGTKFVKDEPISISSSYRPGSQIEDGVYMLIVEAGPSSSKTVPLGNHALYAHTVVIGEISGIDAVEMGKTTAAIWLEGTTLRVVAAEGQEVESVDIYSASGAHVAHNRYDLSGMTPGLYVVTATLTNGARTAAKIVLK